LSLFPQSFREIGIAARLIEKPQSQAPRYREMLARKLRYGAELMNPDQRPGCRMIDRKKLGLPARHLRRERRKEESGGESDQRPPPHL
jgi:hypothetical protein